jgi:TP53 regulating kinase and related kinases
LEHFPRFETRIGAEARIELVTWLGRPAIRKIRLRKNYRNEKLDLALRTRRTKQEIEIMHSSKLAGVRSPYVYFGDPKSAEIIMEYLQGTLLKDALAHENEKQADVLRKLGKDVGKLHSENIIHGDLTSKNVILESSGKGLALFDFGLSFVSERIEDKAEDLHLLKQALRSTLEKAERANLLFKDFLAGYSSTTPRGFDVIISKQVSEIEKRGRYARVD